MYNHEQLLEFGKRCAESISEKPIDINKMGENYAVELLNAEYPRKQQHVHPEDIIVLLASTFYGTNNSIADLLIKAVEFSENCKKGSRKQIISALHKSEIERCQDPEYFLRTWYSITGPNGIQIRPSDFGIDKAADIKIGDHVVTSRRKLIMFNSFANEIDKKRCSQSDYDGLRTYLNEPPAAAKKTVEYGLDSDGRDCARLTIEERQLTSVYLFYRRPWEINKYDNYKHIVADRFGPLISSSDQILKRRENHWRYKGYIS